MGCPRGIELLGFGRYLTAFDGVESDKRSYNLMIGMAKQLLESIASSADRQVQCHEITSFDVCMTRFARVSPALKEAEAS